MDTVIKSASTSQQSKYDCDPYIISTIISPTSSSLSTDTTTMRSVFTPPSILYSPPLKSPTQYYRYRTTPECSDRFIPIREPHNWNLRYNMIKETTRTSMMRYKQKDSSSQSSSSSPTGPAATTTTATMNGQTATTTNTVGQGNVVGHNGTGNNIGTVPGSNNNNNSSGQSDMFRNGLAYQCLLKNELLGAEIEDINEYKQIEERKVLTPLMNRNVFRVSNVFFSNNKMNYRHFFCFQIKFRTREIRSEPTSPYSLSPISPKSQKMLRSPRKTARKISKMPFKILDAPELQDDFYLNLVDWSSTNILSVGLGFSVYLWSACTSQVTRLCDFSSTGNSITSVSWSERVNN